MTLCTIVSVTLCLTLVVFADETDHDSEYCHKLCMVGQGGNLCKCNAVHFAGKRGQLPSAANIGHKHNTIEQELSGILRALRSVEGDNSDETRMEVGNGVYVGSTKDEHRVQTPGGADDGAYNGPGVTKDERSMHGNQKAGRSADFFVADERKYGSDVRADAAAPMKWGIVEARNDGSDIGAAPTWRVMLDGVWNDLQKQPKTKRSAENSRIVGSCIRFLEDYMDDESRDVDDKWTVPYRFN